MGKNFKPITLGGEGRVKRLTFWNGQKGGIKGLSLKGSYHKALRDLETKGGGVGKQLKAKKGRLKFGFVEKKAVVTKR